MVAGGGGFNLGDAVGRIIIDPSGVQQGVDRAQNIFRQGLSSIGDGISALGGQMARIGGAMTVLSAPVLLFGKQGVDAASAFEDALRQIEVRAGLTAAEMDQVRTKALEIGRDTAFSAGQGAEAFLQLLTTGQTVEEAFAIIDSVMAGAAASGEDLGFVSDALTDIMAAFGLEAGDAEGVVNALAAAAGSSSATMSDLILGFRNVGGVARQFGLSVEDTAAILATFSENGIKGAEAGTQLRSMLNNMSRQTEDTTSTWQRLGISLFDATGRARPLNDVMSELSTRLAGMSDADRIATIQALAGTYGQLGLAALTTGEGFDVMLAKMAGATSASDVAQARMDTFSGSVEQLRGSVETLQINALTPLMENALRPLIDRLVEIVNAVNDWVVANPELAGQIALVIGAIAVGAPVVTALGIALSALGTIVGVVGGAIALLVSPIGIAIAAASALLAAYLTNFGGVRDFIDNEVRPRLEQFFNWLGDVWGNHIRPGLEALYNWFVVDALPAVRDFVANEVQPRIVEFGNTLRNLWSNVSAALNAFRVGVQNTIGWVITNVIVPAVTRVQEFITTLQNLRSGIDAWGGVASNAGTVANMVTSGQVSVGDVFNALGNAIRMEFKAGGGDVTGGRPYMVGEAGPEVFVPGRSGTIIPNDALGGVNIQNLTIHADTYEDGRAAARGFADEMAARRRAEGAY